MAILFTDGFDSYGTATGTNLLTRWAVANRSASFSTTTPYGVGQSHVPVGTAVTDISRITFTATPTVTIGAAVNLASLGTSGQYPLFGLLSSSTWMMGLVAMQDGSILVSRMTSQSATVTIGQSAPGRIKQSTWYYIEFSVTVSDTVGTVQVRVDGETVISLTNVDTRNGTPTTIDTLYLGSNGISASNHVLVDDLYISDSITPIGPLRIYTLSPSADTAQKQWSATNGFAVALDSITSNITTTSYSTRGTGFTALANTQVSGVTVYCGAYAQSIKLGIAELSSVNPGTVSTILYESSVVARSATAGYQEFTFSPINFTAGNAYAIYVTRTDGTATSPVYLSYSSAITSLDPTNSLAYAFEILKTDNAIAVGDTTYLGAGGGIPMIIKYANNSLNYTTTLNLDIDSSYVSASTPGDFDLYEVANTAFTSGTIAAVNHLVWARKTDAAARNISLTTKSGATVTDSANVALSASYVGYSKIYETDPATAAAWTVSGVNNLQIGQKVIS